jgi:hypothetical protein
MTSRLALYNGALRILGQRKLSTLTDSVESRRLLDDCYDEVVQRCSEAGMWNFMGVSVAIEASVDVEPEFGYSYAVEKPSDWLRTVAVSGNGNFDPPLGPGEYVDEGEYWNCNVDPLYVRYISDDDTAGGDLSLWTAHFTKAVQYELAFEIAPHLTSMSASAMQELERRMISAMRDAKSKDAMNQAPERPPSGRLVRSRGGRHGGSWRERR